MPKTQTTVNFDEIFNFAAKKPFNVHWNTANDLFFNDLLTYKSQNTIYLEDTEHDLDYNERHPEAKYKYTEDQILARRIIVAFMKEHKLKEMLVLND